MSHRILTPADIPAHVASRPALAPFGPVARVEEIGDGNLNHVFRLHFGDGGTAVLKQSMPYVRIDASWALTPTRIEHEARSYAQWEPFAPGIAPKLHDYDPAAFAMVVEDLAGHVIWREALNAGDVHPDAASDLGAFCARVAFHTSPLRLAGAGVHDLRAAASNPVMGELMEDVVFRFPYAEHPHNSFAPEAAGRVAALRADAAYREAVDVLRQRWIATGEALLHGDLHTGSVMVAPGSTRVIDSEFSLFGPIAWDVGELLGNLLMAVVRAATLERTPAPDVLGLAGGLWTGFEDELRRLWPDRAETAPGDGFLAGWLERLRADTIGYAGLEMVRRIIGSGKAEDVSTLTGDAFARASATALDAGRALVLGREELTVAATVDTVLGAASA